MPDCKKYLLNTHLSFNKVKNASRILKETESLVKNGLFNRVSVIGLWEKDVDKHEDIDQQRAVRRVALLSSKLPKGALFGFIRLLEFYLRVLLVLRKTKTIVIQPHNIETLPIAVLYKAVFNKKVKIVYDAHELETEKIGAQGLWKKVLKKTERNLITIPDATLVVGDKIAEWYQNSYSGIKNLCVIKNTPVLKEEHLELPIEKSYFRDKFKIPVDHIMFIFQGNLAAGRNIELLLKIFSKVKKDKHIVFMGNGSYQSLVHEYEMEFSNIHHHDSVPMKDVLSYSKRADIGIVLNENTCLNNYYCLPNKLFEYILAGLPVIGSDFPEIGKVIDDFKCGWRVSPNEYEVCALVNSITHDDINKHKPQIKNNLGWHIEEKKLINIYRKIMNNS